MITDEQLIELRETCTTQLLKLPSFDDLEEGEQAAILISMARSLRDNGDMIRRKTYYVRPWQHWTPSLGKTN